jgi:OHCU decarboxylase
MSEDFRQELICLNQYQSSKMYEEFLRCCGSTQWAQEMTTQRRPFCSTEQFFGTGNLVWWNLPKEEWLAAFAAHPKIGDRSALREKFAKPNSWEGHEQSGANSASEEVLESLEILNNEYIERHGFVFLICATGKSANEMLEALKLRVNNDSETEVRCTFRVLHSTKFFLFHFLLDSKCC